MNHRTTTDGALSNGHPGTDAPKMNPELKAKWIAALRSGEYQQGKNYLLHNGNYCCLGVLLKIQGCEIEREFPGLDDRMTALLPPPFRAGLTAEIMSDLGSRNDGDSAYLNDEHSFAQIADYIEANL